MACAWTPRRVDVISLNALAVSGELSRSRLVEMWELQLALPQGLEGSAQPGDRTAHRPAEGEDTADGEQDDQRNEQDADFERELAEFAWLSVATRRSAELARTRCVKELAHSTSDRPISATADELVASGGASWFRPIVMPCCT